MIMTTGLPIAMRMCSLETFDLKCHVIVMLCWIHIHKTTHESKRAVELQIK